jgi:LysR family transcriptional regulator, nitrogen assimilation regulatory protein
MDDLRQYKYFLAVTEEGSFRRAAEKLDITHGAIGQSIRRLEDIHGVKLFERTKKGMEPTPYGRLLIEKAKQAIDLFESFQIEVRRLKNRELGNLVIGCDPQLTQCVIGSAVTRLLQAYPNWSFEVRPIPWDQAKGSFETREISVYIGYLLPRADISHHSVERSRSVPGVYVCRPDHPLAGRDEVTRAEVADQLFAYLPLPPALAQIEPEYDLFVPDRRIVAGDAGLLKQIILSSDTICGVHLFNYLDELERNELKMLNVKDPVLYGSLDEYRMIEDEDGYCFLDIFMVSHKTQMPFPAAVEFRKTVKDVISEHVSCFDEVRDRQLARGTT